jgi:hypothetical protein
VSLRRHVALVTAGVLGAVGALFGGLGGFVAGSLSAGDAGPTDFAMWCWLLVASFGGACVGATPGLLWGYSRGWRWVYPILWAAGATVVNIVITLEGWLDNIWLAGGPRQVNLQGPLNAGLLLIGFMVGAWMWTGSSTSPVHIERGPRRTVLLLSIASLGAGLLLVGLQMAWVSDYRVLRASEASVAKYCADRRRAEVKAGRGAADSRRITYPLVEICDDEKPIRPIVTPPWSEWSLGWIAVVGASLSAGLASLPWGLFYLLRRARVRWKLRRDRGAGGTLSA